MTQKYILRTKKGVPRYERTAQVTGFTLIETIIYVGLFGIMFTGIFVSIYPLFTGAARLTQDILTDGETAFVLAKIRYGLTASVTSEATVVTSPVENSNAPQLIVMHGMNEILHIDTSMTCTTPSPLLCRMITFSQDGRTLQSLNTDRVQFTNFRVHHYPPNPMTGAPRYVEVSFNANGESVGPVRYYLNF